MSLFLMLLMCFFLLGGKSQQSNFNSFNEPFPKGQNSLLLWMEHFTLVLHRLYLARERFKNPIPVHPSIPTFVWKGGVGIGTRN